MSILQLVLIRRGSLQFFVKTPTGKDITSVVEASCTIDTAMVQASGLGMAGRSDYNIQKVSILQ